MAPPRSSGLFSGVEGLKWSQHGLLAPWKSDWPSWAETGLAIVQPHHLSLLPVPGTMQLTALSSATAYSQLRHLSWRHPKGGGEDVWVLTGKACGGCLWNEGWGIGSPLLCGSSSSFLCQGRFSHQLLRKQTRLSPLPICLLSPSISFPDWPRSPALRVPELRAWGSKVRPSLLH